MTNEIQLPSCTGNWLIDDLLNTPVEFKPLDAAYWSAKLATPELRAAFITEKAQDFRAECPCKLADAKQEVSAEWLKIAALHAGEPAAALLVAACKGE